MKPNYLKLKKTRKEFFVALTRILNMYEHFKQNTSKNSKLKKLIGNPIDYTLEHYDDFYEWLQGEI